MKLFAKYNRLNILATAIIFIVGSCTFYVLLHYILVRQMDSALRSEQQEIRQYISVHNALPEIINTREQQNIFIKGKHINEGYETVRYNEGSTGKLYRDIQFNVVAGNEHCAIIIRKPLEGTRLLLKLIILVTVVMIALILVAGVFINRRILNNLWQPFYHTVGQIKSYDLSAANIVVLQPTGIDEFSLLNQSISNMMERVQQDYEALKKFTGHAAHEMQTPLAVIRSHMDMLMQQEQLLHGYGPHIMEIERAVTRLSRLNQSLLLLTKVENRQFVLNEDVPIDEIIESKCAELAEMMQVMDIILSLSVVPFKVRFHRQLAEIMVGNLINNAIRYNITDGIIEIRLEGSVLSIANTSPFTALEQKSVFQRFYRHSDVKAEGNGLGLSIVKQICDFAGFSASYAFTRDKHVFNIDFNSRIAIS